MGEPQASEEKLVGRDQLRDAEKLRLDLFEDLWRAKARIRLPDTILIKFGRVQAWYFSSRKNPSPQILKKRSSTLRNDTKQKLFDAFAKKKTPRDLVARWIYLDPATSMTVIQHFTVASLHLFLSSSDPAFESVEGILQRWEPLRGRNAVSARCHWSSHCVNIECRTNRNVLSRDGGLPLDQRLATFEGPCRHSLPCRTNRFVEQQVRDQSKSIASAIDSLIMPTHKLWKITLNFVPSREGEYLLSWSSGIVTVDVTQIGKAKHGQSSECVAPSQPEQVVRGVICPSPRARLDGSIFHIPKLGMSKYKPPEWMRPTSAGQPVPQPSDLCLQRLIGGLSSPRSWNSRIPGVDMRSQKMWTAREALSTLSSPRNAQPCVRERSACNEAYDMPKEELPRSMLRAAQKYEEMNRYLGSRRHNLSKLK